MVISKNFTSDYQIIYPQNPTESVKHAAEELKAYLFKITGACLPMYQDNRHPEEKEFVIGYTNRGGFTDDDRKELGDEGFIIKSEGERIFIIGSGKRGALYGVYSFLEEYCGVRYYTNDFEKIPENPLLEIVPIEENRQIPVFSYRNSYWYSNSDLAVSAKLKINGGHGRIYEPYPKLGDFETYYGGFCHTITALNETNDYWNQPCLCDEEVYARVLKNVRKILEANPDAKIVSITQTDGNNGACKCDKCRAINDAEESEAGTNLMFVNRIAEELEAEYPNVVFDTFAYNFTRKPPKTVRPRKNVVVRMCTIQVCNRHPIVECVEHPGYIQDDSFANYIRRWAEISDNLAVWNYCTNFTNFPVMFPNWEAMRNDERFFADNKVVSVFEQGNITCPNGEFGELRAYVVAKLLWNPYMSDEEYWGHIKELINDFYGNSGKYIYEFIKLQLACSENSHFNVYFDNAGNNIYDPTAPTRIEGCRMFIEKANGLFDKAEAAAENGFVFANVRRSRIQLLDYIDFYLRDVRDATEDDAEKEAITEKIIANNRKRFDYMKMYGVSSNREFHNMDDISEVDLSDYGLRW